MKKLTSLICLVVLGMSLVAPLLADTTQTLELSDQEMAILVGGSCTKAAGIMTAFAFTSGYVFAINPGVSLGFLAAAGAIGAGIAVLC